MTMLPAFAVSLLLHHVVVCITIVISLVCSYATLLCHMQQYGMYAGFIARQKFDISILSSTLFSAAHVEKWPRRPKV
jgi:hypothetical protein